MHTIAGLVVLFQLSSAEAELLSQLDVGRVEAMTRRLSETVAQSPSGAGFGSAVSGSSEERALADVIASGAGRDLNRREG